ncbi:MAG: hypothetical protein A2X48_08285 [Lentisphaerae bacterium GWF2_49_21]|nr:MAG: hypothetical protein A2X48_08285 [Lentisphaerae bacterium GWF2_49_21]
MFRVEDSPGLIVESHHHLYHELDYVIRGEGEYAIGGRKIPVSAGDVIYIGRAIHHRRGSSVENPIVLCNLDVEDSMLFTAGSKKLLWPLWKKWDFSKVEDQKFISAVKILLKLMPKGEKRRSLDGRQWRNISDGLVSVLNSEWTMLAKISPGLHELAMRIRLHPGKYLSLGEEAERMKITRHWLSRRFHGVFGVTMLEYRDLARTDKAVKALLSGGVSIEKLGAILGYSSKSHFINTFKRFAGCTPGTFRNLHGKRTGPG